MLTSNLIGFDFNILSIGAKSSNEQSARISDCHLAIKHFSNYAALQLTCPKQRVLKSFFIAWAWLDNQINLLDS